MNIFYLHKDPVISANILCDEHIRKMNTETAQMLCTTHWMTGSEAPYKKYQPNHPCNIWIRKSINNYRWLVNHGLAICEEYTRRYNKRHKSEDVIEFCRENEPDLPNVPFTEPPQVVKEDCLCDDTITAYIQYYIKYKLEFAHWNHSETPSIFL